MRHILILFVFLTSILFTVQTHAQTGGVGVSNPGVGVGSDPRKDEWVMSVSREVEYAEWLAHINKIKEKDGLTSCLKSAYGDIFLGQMTQLKEKFSAKGGTDEAYSQKLYNEPFGFSVSTCSNSNGNHVDNVTIGGNKLQSPESSIFHSLENFRAFWLPVTLDQSWIGDMGPSGIANFPDFKFRYVRAIDYFFRDYILNSRSIGLGIIGTDPTPTDFFKGLQQPLIYYGTVTVVSSELTDNPYYAQGSVTVVVDDVQKLIHVNVSYPYNNKMERTLPFPKVGNSQKGDNIWIGFYGSEGNELGGTFIIDDPNIKTQGVFLAKREP